MKTLLSTILFLFLSGFVGAQYNVFDIRFDDSNLDDTLISFDTSSINVWQIGVPNKIIFDTSYSPNRAILTDTINAYPPNDTSVFTFEHYMWWPVCGAVLELELSFKFKINTDLRNLRQSILFGCSNFNCGN